MALEDRYISLNYAPIGFYRNEFKAYYQPFFISYDKSSIELGKQ